LPSIFARRRSDLAFRPVVWLFAAFILLCGTTHWLDVLTLWIPAYGVEAGVKILTAVVSIVTAVAPWRRLPHALALPSQSQLQAVNAALRESEALHRARFEHSPVPLYTMEGDDALTGVSDSWLALLGCARQDVIGRRSRTSGQRTGGKCQTETAPHCSRRGRCETLTVISAVRTAAWLKAW
jgi:PAS domain-containing protein